MSFSFFSPLRTPDATKTSYKRHKSADPNKIAKKFRPSTSSPSRELAVIENSCSSSDENNNTDIDGVILDIAKSITERKQESESEFSDFGEISSAARYQSKSDVPVPLFQNTADNSSPQVSKSAGADPNLNTHLSNKTRQGIHSQMANLHDISRSNSEESLDSHIEPSQWRPDHRGRNNRSDLSQDTSRLESTQDAPTTQSAPPLDQLRYIVSADFEAVERADVKKCHPLYIEDVQEEGVELFLVRLPSDVCMEEIEKKAITFNDSQLLCKNTDENGIIHGLEVRSSYDDSLKNSNMTLLLPSKNDQKNSYFPAPAMEGRVIISKSINVQTKVTPTQPKDDRMELPSGMKFRNIPFGAGNVHECNQANGVTPTEDSTEKQKEKKKKTHKHKDESKKTHKHKDESKKTHKHKDESKKTHKHKDESKSTKKKKKPREEILEGNLEVSNEVDVPSIEGEGKSVTKDKKKKKKHKHKDENKSENRSELSDELSEDVSPKKKRKKLKKEKD